MLSFPLVEKKSSSVLIADARLQADGKSAGKVIQQSQTVQNKSADTSGNRLTGNRIHQPFGEINATMPVADEPVIKDHLWNIYTGNPGFYVTDSDTVNFGSVTSLSDSAFLASRHTVEPVSTAPYGFVGKERILPNQDWVLVIILFLWMIFASVRVGFLKYLGQLFESLINFHTSSRLYHERGYKTMSGAVRLDLIFHLILPLSIFQVAKYYNIMLPGYPESVFYLALLLIINGYLFTKILLTELGGSVMMLKSQTAESVFNIRLYYKALGIFLLPVVTIHAISSETQFITTWVMPGLILIMYISALIRSIYVGIRKDVSIFYLILYLCTLEILPLLLIFKLMSSE